jgi:hypothetical protein
MKQHRRHIFKWLFALWMLCCIGSVNAASLVEAPAAWRTTPVMSENVRPNYEFHSTSACTPVVGATSYTSTTVYTPGSQPAHARKDSWGDPDDDDNDNLPTGVVPTTPVGEPLILLLLAGLFVLYKRRRTA